MLILDNDGVESKGKCHETFSEDSKLPKKRRRGFSDGEVRVRKMKQVH